MKRIILITISIVGLAIILLYGINWTKQFLQIDSCLDRGGRWNYELNECEEYFEIDKTNLTEFYWHAEVDTISNKEVLLRGKLIDSLGKSPNELIEILNKRESKSQIEYLEFSRGMLRIKILNDEFLTEQMGSTGAYCYLGETVFTMTENELIKCVRIEMNSGSHANSDIYKRTDFKDLIK